MKTIKNIKAILYNENQTGNPLVKKFLGLKNIKKFAYQSEEQLTEELAVLKNKKFKSKEALILKEYKGRFFQNCPGTPGMIRCNYRLINSGFDCLYNCAYCYLQTYLNAFGITYFINTDNILKEIDIFIEESDPQFIYRIGTGEFTDSLMIDEFTGFNCQLIEKFAKFPNLMLELKTKSDNISHLLDIKEKGSTVLAWSLNTEKNIENYEADTASLEKRLNAARQASQAGYLLAFHFDPIIIYPGWQADYAALLERLFEVIDDKRIVWISLGGFRYTADFKEVLQNNFPAEKMTTEEFFPGSDNKYRYFKPVRRDIYLFMKTEILKYTGYPFLYMCMESADMWEQVFGKLYQSADDLENDMSDWLKDFPYKNL